ncbi:GAF domain-containing protein, partial [Streptomyces carpinensis]
MRLVAASGLAAQSAEAWADLSDDQDVAPAYAMRRGEYAWVGGDSLGMGAAGTAAVPLPGADGPIGVLSVIMEGSGEPDEVQRSFLHSVAEWAAAGLEDLPGRLPVRGSPAGSEQTVRMGKLTSALAEALTSQEVVQAVAAHVLPPFGADGLIFWVFEGGQQRVVGSAGYPQEFLSLLDGIPVADYAVATDVLGTRTPQFIESASEYCRRYPALEHIPPAAQKNAWAFLPMIASGRSIGMCLVSFAQPRSFSDEERTLLTALSGLAGQSLGRARLYDVEHARAQGLQRGLLPRTLP